MSQETNGTVKWFNGKKGFGFITAETTEKEYFVHFSEVKTTGYKTLDEGQKVTFHPEENDKGLRATNVIIL